MKDISGEEFKVGDTLKVVKFQEFNVDLQVGDVIECVGNDGTNVCRFQKLSTGLPFFYYNDHLQKL